LDEDRGLFKRSYNKSTVYPSPLSNLVPEYQTLFYMLGRITAKIVMTDICCEINFSRFFLKHILQKDLTFSDLEEIVFFIIFKIFFKIIRIPC
jgi:HECT-domain (ubiquitin-transferase)